MKFVSFTQNGKEIRGGVLQDKWVQPLRRSGTDDVSSSTACTPPVTALRVPRMARR